MITQGITSVIGQTNELNCSSTYTSELFFSLTEILHLPLLSLKKNCTTGEDISCILLDADYFSLGLLLSRYMQQLPGECAVCSHTNGKYVVLSITCSELNVLRKCRIVWPFWGGLADEIGNK